jgi:hypothetical protein
MSKSIIYFSSIVENKNPHRLASGEYYLVYVSDSEGTMFPALFTQREVTRALIRASKNPEDAPRVKIGWFRKLLLKLKSICQ